MRLRECVLSVLLIILGFQASAAVVPFPVDTGYHHSVLNYYSSPGFGSVTFSLEQGSQPGSIGQTNYVSAWGEYAERYGDFWTEAFWRDDGYSWAKSWSFGSLSYEGPANFLPSDYEPRFYFSLSGIGSEIVFDSHVSRATLFVGGANGETWQAPPEIPFDPGVVPSSSGSGTGDGPAAQPLVITVGATDLTTMTAIPRSTITAAGQSVPPEGYIVQSTLPNSRVEVPVSVQGNNNYKPSVVGWTTPPLIMSPMNEGPYFGSISMDTTHVWAGQMMFLSCNLPPGPNQIPVVESYEWEIEGDAVKEVKLVETNGFFKVPLTDKTNSWIMFAWLGTTPSPTVTLKVKIKGMEFTQKAFFQVKKPPVQPLPHKNGTINASPTVATPDDVQLYRIDDFSGRHRGGYLATAVGQDESIGWDDMHFFHKIVSSLREARDSSGDIIQAHYWNITNKHDGSAVPYDLVAEIRMNLYGTTRSSFSPPSTEPARRGKIMEDSPVQPIYEAAFRTEVDDRFEVWLMHKAGAYTSTWVPIAKGNWFWHFVYWKGANNIGSFSEKEWDVSVLAQTDDFPIWSGTFDAPRRPVQ